MLKKQNAPSGNRAVWGRPLLFGTLVGAVLTLLVLFGEAAVCVLTDVPVALIPLLAALGCALGAAVGGVTAGKIARKNGWLTGLLSGVCLWLLLSLVGFACVGKTEVIHALVSAVICLVCGAVGGIVGVNLRQSKFSV